jgi:MoaA/NifB/PqqE/SkfB family radical SAM enzyme
MVIWAITSNCNLHCRGCSFPKEKVKHNVKFEDIAKAVAFFRKNNVRMVALTGGEPLIYPHLEEILMQLKKEKIVVGYIATNGTLLTQEKARMLAKYDVNIIGLSVNLDYFLLTGKKREQETERIRKVTRLLKDSKINFYGGVILSKVTKDVRKTCSIMQSLGIDCISFSYPQLEQKSSYRAASDDELLDLTRKEADSIVRQIRQIKREGKVKVYNTFQSLDEFERYYQGKEMMFGCMAGRRMFYLDWDLDLYKCFTLPKKIGNLSKVRRLPECNADCKKCLQHAFKDPSIFYHAIEGAYGVRDSMFSARFGTAARIASSKNSVNSGKALIEIATSPFI